VYGGQDGIKNPSWGDRKILRKLMEELVLLVADRVMFSNEKRRNFYRDYKILCKSFRRFCVGCDEVSF
jgi:hypothetical protein